jgi:hypothetical protein
LTLHEIVMASMLPKPQQPTPADPPLFSISTPIWATLVLRPNRRCNATTTQTSAVQYTAGIEKKTHLGGEFRCHQILWVGGHGTVLVSRIIGNLHGRFALTLIGTWRPRRRNVWGGSTVSDRIRIRIRVDFPSCTGVIAAISLLGSDWRPSPVCRNLAASFAASGKSSG